MGRYYREDRLETPVVGVSAIAFLILAGITCTAFFAVSKGVFEPAPSAHLYAFSRTDAQPPGREARLGASPNPLPSPASAMPAAAAELDLLQTSALEPEATQAPLCDVQVCMQAYRSFRASDCTFQPYDGPRRLCTR